MLSPEVWNFQAPKPIVSNKNYNFDADVIEAIKKQLFNHHVSITLPNTLKAPENLINSFLEDSQYYRINKISISEIFNKNFISFFVKNGAVTALSVETIDSNVFFALIPSGKLILSVNEKIFQELGLISISKSSNSYRKIIVLDLINGHEYLKNYESTKEKLSHKNLIFDVIIDWEPYDALVCPSSIAAYFSQKGYFIKTCNISFQQRLSYNVNVPIYNGGSEEENLMEWLGAFNLQCNMSDDNYISAFNFNDDYEMLGQVYFASFTGLLTCKRIEKLILAISNYMTVNDFSNWIGIVINGFKGSFICTKNENFFQSVGDHHHTVILDINKPKLVQFFQISQ